MKYLVLIAVIAVVIWLIRTGRPPMASQRNPTRATKSGASNPQEMAICPTCGVHFPETDGIQGRAALYCSDSHRSSAEA